MDFWDDQAGIAFGDAINVSTFVHESTAFLELVPKDRLLVMKHQGNQNHHKNKSWYPLRSVYFSAMLEANIRRQVMFI